MASSQGATKANQKVKVQEAASRLKHLRATKFETEGFKSNEPIPSVSAARSMYYRNLRKMNGLTPVPSKRG